MTPHELSIVNVAEGGWYPKGQARQKESIARLMPEVVIAHHSDLLGTNHYRNPYLFKLEALRRVTTRYAIWADSSVWFAADLFTTDLPEILEMQGYLVFENGGWNNGQWCNDRSLQAFGYTREQAKDQTHADAKIVGFDLQSEQGKTILSAWELGAPLFKGNWRNDTMTESPDPYCLGHRHDQSILSLVMAKFMLTFTPQTNYIGYPPNEEGKPIIAQGL